LKPIQEEFNEEEALEDIR